MRKKLLPLLALLFALAVPAANAQQYPVRAIKMIVPFPPGGATDVVGRMVANKLGERLGQPVVVDNKPGAGGALGSEIAARSAPDGYTILMATSSTHSIGPNLQKLGYDPVRDFAPICHVADVPNVLVVSPALPVHSVAELVAYAKARPGQLNFASSGVGTIVHLNAELFKMVGGLDMVHVPYKGTALAIPDIANGSVAMVFDSLASVLPHIKSGKVRPIALNANRRSPLLPELPTLAEAGMPQFNVYTWFGAFAPAGTPAPVVVRLNTEIQAALKDPALLERFAAVGAEPAGGPPEVLLARVRDDGARWAEVIRAANVMVLLEWQRRLQTLAGPLAIVDLETTGSDPAVDRITEIGVIEVDGFEAVSRWSTLVNPGLSIPSPIQALTGITPEMVAAAPRFRDLAEGLFERLAGRVFVAHNARFDYGFLRREFERAGKRFHARTVCTVRLSRRLYPEERRHDLDSLIERHRLPCAARHRALPDAEAAWQFLKRAAEEHGDDVLAVAARQIARQPSLPAHIDRADIDAIPEAPGVYFFYGEAGAPLYVGKSRNLRSRVLAHFSAGLRSEKETRLAREVRRIDWHRTAGELGALLLEARLVKELAPLYNRRLRRSDALCGFVFDGTRLRLAELEDLQASELPQTLPLVRGVFRSRRAALAALRALADAERLCLQAVGFEAPARRGACFRHQLGRCAGVCAGRENPHLHLARLGAALARLEAAHWPHHGAVGIVERSDEDRAEVHVVDRWCYLGAAASDAEVAELLESRRGARLDYDHFRILARHLSRPGVRVVPLAG